MLKVSINQSINQSIKQTNKQTRTFVGILPSVTLFSFFVTLALYGWLFRDNPEAAFSNYRLWESIGFIAAFGYSFNLCTDIKLYICMGNLVIGMALYAVVEFMYRRSTNMSVDITPVK